MIRPPPKSTLFPHTPLSRSTSSTRWPRCGSTACPTSRPGSRPTPSPTSPRESRPKDGPRLNERSCVCSQHRDRKSTRLNSSHGYISYAVFCLKKKKKQMQITRALRRMALHLVLHLFI